jgi:hypothetical protein
LRIDKENTINVYSSDSRPRNKHFLTRNEFFDTEDVIVSRSTDAIVITRPTLDYLGKSAKIDKPSNVSYHFRHKIDIPNGVYTIDQEDSNEDKIVIYLNEEE